MDEIEIIYILLQNTGDVVNGGGLGDMLWTSLFNIFLKYVGENLEIIGMLRSLN